MEVKPKILVEEMEFEPLKEDWCDYKLEDGTIVKIKLIATDFRKLLNEVDELGRQRYQFSFQTVNRIVYPKPKRPGEELVS